MGAQGNAATGDASDPTPGPDEADGPAGLSPRDDAQDLPVRISEPDPILAPARAGSATQPPTDVAGGAARPGLQGVNEIRVREASGAYRAIYWASGREAVYVLHAFQKKTQATPKHDLELAKQRFKQLEGKRK